MFPKLNFMESNILFFGIFGLLFAYYFLKSLPKETQKTPKGAETHSAHVTQPPVGKKRKKKSKPKADNQEEEKAVVNHADVNKSDSEPEPAHSSVLILKNPEMHAVDESDEWIQPSKVIRIRPGNSKAPSVARSASSSSASLTKKQRQNAKKADKLKAAKADEQALQEQRLEAYRKAKEREYLDTLVKQDQNAQVKAALDRGKVPNRTITKDTWFSSKGKAIWDD